MVKKVGPIDKVVIYARVNPQDEPKTLSERRALKKRYNERAKRVLEGIDPFSKWRRNPS